jgi:hypothetical protein
MNAAQIQASRRGHWAIERLHCVRDVSLDEDASTARTGHAPRNLAAFRNLVIGLCALNGARSKKRASFLPRFQRKAQNNRQFAVDLVTVPLVNG